MRQMTKLIGMEKEVVKFLVGNREAGWKDIRSGANGEKGTVLSANTLDNRRNCRHIHMLECARFRSRGSSSCSRWICSWFDFHSSLSALSKSRHRVSQRQNCSDYDYSKGDKLDQIIWPFSVGISISEETRGANAHRRRRFHVCYTPFVAEVGVD